MSIYTGSAERSFLTTRAALVNAVRNFEGNPRGNGRVIRDLLEADRRQFYSISIEILRDLPDSRGIQFLVALLVSNGLLLEALCDPALNKEQALALGRAAVRVDPMADAALARGLADSETGQGSVLVRDAPRLMDTLCTVGDPAHMMASMLRLLRHPNPVMRSKAVKVVGRGSKSPKWVRQRLNEADPRVRANAIEALWSIDNEEARSVLQFACADTNNRAAANALLGLYFLGENSVLTDLVKMADHESPLFRSSAAWAMGEMGDPRFLESLRPLLNATDATVRKRAFAALGQIKAATALSTAGCKWHVGAKLMPPEGSDTSRKLSVAIVGEDPRDQPKISPLGFILSEGRSYVMTYRVTEGPPLEAMSVVFVMPRVQEGGNAFHEAVDSCLKWKRSSDLWSILPYMTGGGATLLEGQEPDPPVFTASPEALHNALAEPTNRIHCTEMWTAVARAIKMDTAARGKRHIIILGSRPEDTGITPANLVVKVRSARLPICAIAPAQNEHLSKFCGSVDATFQVCGEDAIGDAVRQAYLVCLARYEIAYPATEDAQSIKLRVHAPGGWGEAVVAYS